MTLSSTTPSGLDRACLLYTSTLARLAEFTATLEQTRTEMAATEQKIHTLEKQADKLPVRITTQLRESDDAQLQQSLKATLMTLELKRTELLTCLLYTSRCV